MKSSMGDKYIHYRHHIHQLHHHEQLLAISEHENVCIIMRKIRISLPRFIHLSDAPPQFICTNNNMSFAAEVSLAT